MVIITGYKNFNVKIKRIFNEKNQIILKVQKNNQQKSIPNEIIPKLMSYPFFGGEKGSFETENNYFIISIQMQE